MRRFPYPEIPEFKVFKKLTTPQKVQDFLGTIPINFEKTGETYRSPLQVLRENKAHCMEGAMLAAAIFWYHGRKPVLMDFRTAPNDVDHVVTPFQIKGYWGAVSKTNYAVHRYRDPIYKTIRELAMSYFNEYFLEKNGQKTLREYSVPFDMCKLPDDWLVREENAYDIVQLLDDSRHFDMLPKGGEKILRPADNIEIVSSKISEWKK